MFGTEVVTVLPLDGPLPEVHPLRPVEGDHLCTVAAIIPFPTHRRSKAIFRSYPPYLPPDGGFTALIRSVLAIFIHRTDEYFPKTFAA